MTTLGADVEQAILSIMTEVMTPKALGEGRRRSATDGDMDDLSGGREDLCTIGERLEKGPVEGEDSFVDSSILRLRLYGGRGGNASGRRGRRESR